MRAEAPKPEPLAGPALIDTGVWTWSRDRRFPQLAEWFNREARAGRVLICDLIVLELIRMAPNQARAAEVGRRLEGFASIEMDAELWKRSREVQLMLAADSNHRRVPPADLLIAAAAESAEVAVVHYDRDYERISAVSGQDQRWFVADGSLAR